MTEKAAEKGSAHAFFVFGKYDPSEVSVRDPSLGRYVSLKSKEIPHTFGRGTRHRFEKGSLSIVERLINKIMRSGQGKRKLSGKYIRGRGGTGKKIMAMHIVEEAFELVEKRTMKNPLQVLVDAIQNAGPREDVTRISRGGVSYTVSVDVAPLKKVDESLKNLALAAFSGSFNNKTSAAEALAKELISAAGEENTSFSVKRRDEVERIAKASR
ncbi:MAG TPA: 30S ribosomal protein S7 [archaeon]|nr:30S ribosomal protein S7 [archaeon]